MRYEFVKAQSQRYPIALLCELMAVSRSGFYEHLERARRGPSQRELENARLLERVRAVYEESSKRYGSPRVHATLKKEQTKGSLSRIKRLMRREGIYALSKRKFKSKKATQKTPEGALNLLGDGIGVTGINQLWQSDITFIPTNEGWLYLAAVMDSYSKRLVGYAMDSTMKTDLVIQVLRMAMKQRRPGKGLIHHSDRGSQYTSYAFIRELAPQQMIASFTATDACLDNAVIESFWATLKKELVYPGRFATRAEARSKIFEYVEIFYNRQRLHSSLGYDSPADFEGQGLERLAA